jgi:ferredoxin
VGLRAWYAVLNPVRRLTGGERVVEKVLLGDLVIDNGLCDGCRLCMPACPVDALSFGEMLVCDREACIRCFCCAEVCPSGALTKKLELGAG